MLLSLFVVALATFVCLLLRVSPSWFLKRVFEGSPSLLVVLIEISIGGIEGNKLSQTTKIDVFRA